MATKVHSGGKNSEKGGLGHFPRNATGNPTLEEQNTVANASQCTAHTKKYADVSKQLSWSLAPLDGGASASWPLIFEYLRTREWASLHKMWTYAGTPVLLVYRLSPRRSAAAMLKNWIAGESSTT